MQFHWLNKQNNKDLIIFFAGWSFDENPFKFLDCGAFDVIIIYDYNSIDLPEIDLSPYKNINLIAWSMGVFVAYLLKDKLPNFAKKIAINGTVKPVDDEFGIPQKPFILTLRHAKTGLEGKFYQNIFDSNEEFEKYLKTPVERTIENRETELKSLYERIKTTEINYDGFYDKALISAHDKIIPTKNQINFWQENSEIEMLESGHFPYYNFKSWNEILCK